MAVDNAVTERKLQQHVVIVRPDDCKMRNRITSFTSPAYQYGVDVTG